MGIVKLSFILLPSAKDEIKTETREGSKSALKRTAKLKDTAINEGIAKRLSILFNIPLTPSPPKEQQAATMQASLGRGVIREKANPV